MNRHTHTHTYDRPHFSDFTRTCSTATACVVGVTPSRAATKFCASSFTSASVAEETPTPTHTQITTDTRQFESLAHTPQVSSNTSTPPFPPNPTHVRSSNIQSNDKDNTECQHNRTQHVVQTLEGQTTTHTDTHTQDKTTHRQSS